MKAISKKVLDNWDEFDPLIDSDKEWRYYSAGYQSASGLTREEAEAVAALISAAPALWRALDDLLDKVAKAESTCRPLQGRFSEHEEALRSVGDPTITSFRNLKLERMNKLYNKGWTEALELVESEVSRLKVER